MSVYNTESALAGDENCPPSPLILLNSPAQCKTVTDRTPTKGLNSPAQCKTATERTPTKVFSPVGLNKPILKPSAYENLLQFTPQPSHPKVIHYTHSISFQSCIYINVPGNSVN